MKNIPLLLLLFLCSYSSAQSTMVNGIVKDSLGHPLELAHIIATHKDDGTVENYSIADSEGRFRFFLPKGNTYLVTASFLGMKPKSLELHLTAENENLEFVLFPDEDQLEGVELVYEMPIVIIGDTIVYNTDSFVNGTERKLGDVLKKLPGIAVNKNGEIMVDGKMVSKVMVEGKDFFDGDSKLATKNIPADALSKVEVLKNYNEVDQMRGLGNDHDNIAINIKLKEGKKNFWFGDFEAGLGDGGKTRYKGSANLFYYSPKTSMNFIGNVNNVGDVPFNFTDYFRFTGGLQNFNFGGGTSFNINESDLGFLLTQNSRANDLKSTFGAANFSYHPSEAWKISGFSIFSNNQTDFRQYSLKEYIQTNAAEVKTGNRNQRNKLGMVKLSSVFKPSIRFQLDYDLLFKMSEYSEVEEAVSVFSDGNGEVVNPVNEAKENDPNSVNQNFNAYYTLDAENIFAGYLQHFYQEENPFYNAVLQIQPFSDILPFSEGQDSFNVNQNKNVRTHKLDAQIDYYHIINNLSNINLTFGSTLSNQQFNSSIFQVLDSGAVEYFEEDIFNNDVVFNFQDIFLRVHYKFKKGIFTITPGVSLHKYNVQTDQSSEITSTLSSLLLPDFYAIAQLKQSESLRFNYEMTAQFTDVNSFAQAYVFNDYNQLFRGNRNLENAIYHNFRLNYFNFSRFHFTNINTGLYYTRRVNPIRNNTTMEQINHISIPSNSNFADESFSANALYEKSFPKFKASFQSNFSLNTYNLIGNQLNMSAKNIAQYYQGCLTTNFKKAPNFEIGYNRTITQYTNGGVKSIFYTDRPFANVQFNFLNGFTFTADYNYYSYFNKGETIQNDYSFLEVNLYYKKPDSSWEFKVNATNLLDVASINLDRFDEHYNGTNEYFVQPRMLLISLIYNL